MAFRNNHIGAALRQDETKEEKELLHSNPDIRKYGNRKTGETRYERPDKLTKTKKKAWILLVLFIAGLGTFITMLVDSTISTWAFAVLGPNGPLTIILLAIGSIIVGGYGYGKTPKVNPHEVAKTRRKLSTAIGQDISLKKRPTRSNPKVQQIWKRLNKVYQGR